MGWLSHDNLASLSVFSEVALGLILFSLGSVFEAERFKVVGQRVLRVTLANRYCRRRWLPAACFSSGRRWRVRCCWGRSPWKRQRRRR